MVAVMQTAEALVAGSGWMGYPSGLRLYLQRGIIIQVSQAL